MVPIDFITKVQFLQLEVWEIPVALMKVLLRQKAIWLPLQAGCTLPSWCGKNPFSSHCLAKDPRKRRISCICPDIYCPTCCYPLITQDIPSKPRAFCDGTADPTIYQSRSACLWNFNVSAVSLQGFLWGKKKHNTIWAVHR